jgi:protein involved in polysaccharide export with SLBB domain
MKSWFRRAGTCVVVWSALATACLAWLPSPAFAQIPTQAEAMRLLQEDPEAVRQRLLTSGLSPNEIRARLRAAGLPTSALDQFLASGPLDSTTGLNPDALSALAALGMTVDTPDGVELVPLRTGLTQTLSATDSLDGLPIFGLDVFTRASSQFQPLLSGPVPDDYPMGPGDQLVLVLTGEVELAHELEVSREGFIVIPNVGQVFVANLTMAELRALLRTRLARSYSGIERGTTNLSVSVARLRTNQIYVTGEVSQPGAYQLSSVATVTNSLYAAGGPTALASLREVRVQRRNGEVLALDLYPYLLEGDVSGDAMLEQGDVVFVPLKGRRIQLHGAIVRPAYYELARTEDLIDVLQAAGGFAPEALRQRLTIHRVLRPSQRGPGIADRQAIDLELRAEADSLAANYLGGVTIPPIGLQDGDSIVIDSVPALEDGYYVTVAGMVRAPGRFPWQDGMTLRDLVELSRGPIVGADLREAEVSRMPDRREMGQLANRLRVPLDSSYLSQRDADGLFRGPPGLTFPAAGTSPDFELEPFDQVLILPQPDFEMPQAVAIAGEVSIPGSYTLASKFDRVTDLVQRAGGILPTGYAEGARLIRAQDELGRIDLDLVTALDNPDDPDNVILQPGDSLYIPEYSPTVQVRGAVNSPVTVLYRQGMGLDYYIANAGGFRTDADEGRLSVRYANGTARTRDKFLFWSNWPEPGPGSEIVVPAQDPADEFDTRGLITDLVAILGSVATVIIVLVR